MASAVLRHRTEAAFAILIISSSNEPKNNVRRQLRAELIVAFCEEQQLGTKFNAKCSEEMYSGQTTACIS